MKTPFFRHMENYIVEMMTLELFLISEIPTLNYTKRRGGLNPKRSELKMNTLITRII